MKYHTDHLANELNLVSQIFHNSLRNWLSLEVDGTDVADMLSNALILDISFNKTTGLEMKENTSYPAALA